MCPAAAVREESPGRQARKESNPAGDIVGNYTDAVGAQHGFLLSSGNFTTIDVPGALVGAAAVMKTSPRGISPSGEIVGSFTAPVSNAPWGSPAYCPAAGSVACIKGFLYRRGKFSIVLHPSHPGAIPQRITPDGDIYACFHDFDLMASMFGFARSRSGYISLTASGGELSDPSVSVPASMNNGATPDGLIIVGLWAEMANGRSHGFIVENGNFRSWDFPGSTFTYIWDINSGGDFVGVYRDTSDKSHGFLQLSGGNTPITVDYPNAVSTSAVGINPGGAIVGQFVDSAGHTHGFLAVPDTAQ